LVLSNHGGRQLEAMGSALNVLPGIRKATRGKLALFVDGGLRSGLDVARALAMGAEFVFLGRAFMYGVAALGAPGAEHVVNLLQVELAQAMGQIGCPDIAALPRFLANGAP
jgi:L-lactate dehydrogenase (cytochrome)